MKSRNGAISVVAGAALGAAALYFLDPKSGARRRHRVSLTAKELLDSADEAIIHGYKAVAQPVKKFSGQLLGQMHSAGHYADQQARALADQSYDYASGLTGQAEKYLKEKSDAATEYGMRTGTRLWDRIHGAYDSAARSAHEAANTGLRKAWGRTDNARQQAAKTISGASHNTQAWLGHEESSGFGVGTILSSTVGCLAVGMGAMYFLDPEQGRARRTQILDQAKGLINTTGLRMRSLGLEVGEYIRSAGTHTRTVAKDLVSRARINGDELVRDIRTRISTNFPSANNIQFLADADGAVTVTGKIIKEEVERFLSLLQNIPGVEYVINRLTVEEPSPSSSTH